MIMFVTMEDGSTDKQEHEYSIVSRYELIADQCRHVDFSRYEACIVYIYRSRQDEKSVFLSRCEFSKSVDWYIRPQHLYRKETIDTQGTGWLWQWW